MKIKIKRRIRTSSSEQWRLFNADEMDDTGSPKNIGLVDIHYDPEMIYMTLLLWSEFAETLEEDSVQRIIDDIVEEVTEPIGVPVDYSLDYLSPSLNSYKYQTNVEDDEDDEDEDAEEEGFEDRNGRPAWN